MRHSILVAGMILLAASCSNESFNEVVNGQTEEAFAPVKVHINDFSVSLEDDLQRGTRTTQDVAEVNTINAVTLAFYNGSTEVYKSTQAKGVAGFGNFECSLPMGSYTMVAVAYTEKEGSPFVLTSATEAAYTGAHAYETFAYTQAVNITNTSAVDISATLSRIVSMLTVTSLDGKTADVSNVRMTFSAGGKDFNPTTGFAVTNTGFANTVGNSAAIGASSTSSSCLFLATEEQEMDVTIETLDADGNTLFSKTVENVPFMQNRKTILTGYMYTNSGVGGGFTVNTDWLTPEDVGF